MINKTIGIVGGGQLARMLALAAKKLPDLEGVKCHTHIFCPEQKSPATLIAGEHTCAAYEDIPALIEFAKKVDVITYEFENIPAASMAALNEHGFIAPPVKALEISQDRLHEKKFIKAQGIDTTEFYDIKAPDDITPALAALSGQGILKTRRFGYDGKGQWRLTQKDLAPPIDRPCILEAVIDFDKEISVIIARNTKGDTAVYDPIENVHKNHILHTSTAPATLPDTLTQTAQRIATTLADALDYVGVLAVEFFVVGDNLLVNEIAPRVHNSGHLTQDACACGQFEQHIRAILGLPLGDPKLHSRAIMTNLIGDDILDAQTLTPEKNTYLHDYKKDDIRAGRKMGHITRLFPLA